MAKKRNKNDPESLNGLFIYHDAKRTVYAPFFSRNAYIVNKENTSQYTAYIEGYLLSLLIFSIFYIVTKNLLLSIIIALVFLFYNLLSFYRNFIKKASIIENYKKPAKQSFVARQAENLETKNLLTVIVCCFLLSLVILYNGYINRFTGVTYYLNLILSISSFIYAMF